MHQFYFLSMVSLEGDTEEGAKSTWTITALIGI